MAEKDYTITNCKITKVRPGAGGVRAGVPWQILRFEIDDARAAGKEFTKFVNPHEPENHPYVGAPVESMKFTVKKSGDFTNYTVTKILYSQEGHGVTSPKPQATKQVASAFTDQSQPANIPKDVSVCVSYVKDLMCAIIQSNTKVTEAYLPILVDQVTRQGVLMYRDLIKYLQSDEEIPNDA